MTYTVKYTTQYPGGHAADPGYRTTVVMTAKGDRDYAFLSAPDGSNVRRVETRPAHPALAHNFRQLSERDAAKRAPDLEAFMTAYLAKYPHEVK